MIIHEVAHVLGCLLSGAKIKKVKLFSMNGGYVLHGKSKIPLIGSIIISFSPIALGIIVIYFLSGKYMPIVEKSFYSLQEMRLIFVDNWNNYLFWILIYVTVSIVICAIPSKQDFKNSLRGILFLSLIFFILFLSGFSFQEVDFIEEVVKIATFSIFIGIFGLLITILIYIFKKIIFRLISF